MEPNLTLCINRFNELSPLPPRKYFSFPLTLTNLGSCDTLPLQYPVVAAAATVQLNIYTPLEEGGGMVISCC